MELVLKSSHKGHVKKCRLIVFLREVAIAPTHFAQNAVFWKLENFKMLVEVVGEFSVTLSISCGGYLYNSR